MAILTLLIRPLKNTTKVNVVPGYYLIVDVDPTAAVDAEDYPAYSLYMLEVIDSKTVTPKVSTTENEKKVKDINDSTESEYSDLQDSADYDIGDDVPFQLKATLAGNVNMYKQYVLTFTDTLEADRFESIDLKAADIKIKKTSDSSAATVASTDDYDVTVTGVDGADESGFVVTLTFTPKTGSTTLPDTLNGAVITIDFTAELGEGANLGQLGNTNTSKITYSNNPNTTDTGDSPEDTVIVFTYELVVNKVDENNVALEGAAFTLEKFTLDASGSDTVQVDDTHSYTGTWAASTATLSTNAVADDASTPDVDESKDATTFTFTGLDDGIYRLTESTTPDGYNTIDPITFVVSGSHTTLANGLDKTTKKVGDAYVLTGITGTKTKDSENTTATFSENTADGKITGLTTTIINQSGVVLPETGGVGTTIFYVAGSILVLAAAILLITKRRMGSND